MKKKHKKSIFKRFAIFIDKRIVVPITKLVVKITKFFQKISNVIEISLTKTNTLLFVTLFIAIAMFIFVDQKLFVFTNQTAEVLKDQTIEATYNEEAYVVEGLPDKVDITLMGNRSDLFIATQSGVSKVYVDLSVLKPGSHKVNIEYSQPLDSINYSVNPSVATVNIYSKVSETKTLTTDLLNQDSLDDKLSISNVVPEVTEVVIKGTDDSNATNSLTKVANVKALVDINSLDKLEEGTTTVKDAPLKAYDSSGNILDIEIVPSKINVDLEIDSPSKVLPITIIPVGNLGFGKAISNIEQNQQNIVVYGKKSVLDDLDYVPVEVDVSGLKEDREYKIDIPKPKGVRTMSISNVNLKFSLGSASDKDIDDVNIDVRNLNDNYSVQGLSENDIRVSVNAKGVASVLRNITADDIVAYIDLKDYKPGEYEVPVKVEGNDSRVKFVSKTKKVKIRVVEK